MKKKINKKGFYTIKHKQIVVAKHKYRKNGAAVYVCAVIPAWDNVDSLLLHFTPAKGRGNPMAIRMRPDEAVMVIRLLSEAVYKTTEAYKFGLEKPFKKP